MPSDPKVDEDGYTLAELVSWDFSAEEHRLGKRLHRAMFGAPPSPIHRDFCACSACRCGFPLQCIHGAR